MDLKEEQVLRNRIQDHWYYVSKGRALRQFLRGIHVPEVLDVGAGSGIFARQLLDSGTCESAICIDPYYDKNRSEIHNGKRISFVRSMQDQSQRLILMMDVIEHVDDDLSFVRGYAEKIPNGGHMLVTVPAFQFLWSGHDIFLEHRRRYTLGAVEALLSKAGLTPVRSRYFFAALFPAIAAVRLGRRISSGNRPTEPASDLKHYPGGINRPLTWVHDLERHTIFRLNRFFGLTIFSLCRKD